MTLLLFGLLASASASEVEDPDLVWSGIVVPLIGANSQDGPGLGLGGEIFQRPRRDTSGYRLKLTGSLWVTTDLGYTSDFLQVDYRGEKHQWLGRAGFRGWTNHAYVGRGGARAQLDATPREIGNVVYGPFAFLGVSRSVSDELDGFVQLAYNTWVVRPAAGGFLEQFAPPGHRGGTYVDATVGVERNTTDTWPMPHFGSRAEASLRVGASALRSRGLSGVTGVHAEWIGWWSAGRHLTLGARVLGDHTVGPRPFFTADTLGGRWRDEIGSEQAFSGYGRTRTRGDGALAAMFEVRPYFFRTRHRVLDFQFHASAFVEQGWLFDGLDPGPPLPTVGTGLDILFQGAIQCRPFVAWGWRSPTEGARRRPVPLFGISFLDPL